MIDKITLYREVLELEPGSRVFFPLAKLLADKEPAEAILILKKGLSRHPDHVEARIFLIELLSANDGDADLDNELEIVSSILRNYPSFWKIWSSHLAQDSELHDAALAINFFGAGLSGRAVTWTDVIAHGLNALLVEEGDETTPLLPFSSDLSDLHRSSISPRASASANNLQGLARDKDDTEVLEEGQFAKSEHSDSGSVLPHDRSEGVSQSTSSSSLADETLDNFALRMPEDSSSIDALVAPSLSNQTDQPVTVANMVETEEGFGEDEEGEEPFSLRTKTMADLLAEQGDYDGAIDIYNEILSGANDVGQLEIAHRLHELEELRQQHILPGSPKKDSGVSGDEDGGKLVSLLESLASRFENRAR